MDVPTKQARGTFQRGSSHHWRNYTSFTGKTMKHMIRMYFANDFSNYYNLYSFIVTIHHLSTVSTRRKEFSHVHPPVPRAITSAQDPGLTLSQLTPTYALPFKEYCEMNKKSSSYFSKALSNPTPPKRCEEGLIYTLEICYPEKSNAILVQF